GAGSARRRPDDRRPRGGRHRRVETRARPACALSRAVGLGELRGVGEFAERRDFSVLDRKHMDPIGRNLAAGFFNGPGVMTGHEYLIAASGELARRKFVRLLQRADLLEESLHALRSFVLAEDRIVRFTA